MHFRANERKERGRVTQARIFCIGSELIRRLVLVEGWTIELVEGSKDFEILMTTSHFKFERQVGSIWVLIFFSLLFKSEGEISSLDILLFKSVK